MTGSFWWDLLIGVAVALVLAWVILIVALVLARPRGGLLREALRLLPDVLRPIRRLVGDKTLPRGVRIRLGLLLVYSGACPSAPTSRSCGASPGPSPTAPPLRPAPPCAAATPP